MLEIQFIKAICVLVVVVLMCESKIPKLNFAEGETAILPCNGGSTIRKYIWSNRDTSIELDPKDSNCQKKVQDALPHSEFNISNGCLTLHDVRSPQTGIWRCRRETRRDHKDVIYLLDVSEPVKMRLDASQLSKGLIKCIAKGGYPKAAISAVLSPFQNGSEPVTTLKPTKHEFKTAFAERTIVFEGPFQVPIIKQEEELHFVCVGEQNRNGVLEYLVTDGTKLSGDTRSRLLGPISVSTQAETETTKTTPTTTTTTTTKQRAQIENLAPPNITRTKRSKKWIHNQKEEFICQALTSSPDVQLKGQIFEDQTNVRELKAQKRPSLRRGDVYQVTTVFSYIVDRKDENRHVLCTVAHKDEESNVLTPSNRIESNRIAIEEVNFPPSWNSTGQPNIGSENISFAVLANPGPRRDQIHLLTCFDSKCRDEKNFKLLGNVSENEEHLWTIMVPFARNDSLSETTKLHFTVENDYGSVEKHISWTNNMMGPSQWLKFVLILFPATVVLVILVIAIVICLKDGIGSFHKSPSYTNISSMIENHLYEIPSTEALISSPSYPVMRNEKKLNHYHALVFVPQPNNRMQEHYSHVQIETPAERGTRDRKENTGLESDGPTARLRPDMRTKYKQMLQQVKGGFPVRDNETRIVCDASKVIVEFVLWQLIPGLWRSKLLFSRKLTG